VPGASPVTPFFKSEQHNYSVFDRTEDFLGLTLGFESENDRLWDAFQYRKLSRWLEFEKALQTEKSQIGLSPLESLRNEMSQRRNYMFPAKIPVMEKPELHRIRVVVSLMKIDNLLKLKTLLDSINSSIIFNFTFNYPMKLKTTSFFCGTYKTSTTMTNRKQN
jgi:hypothetical protein